MRALTIDEIKQRIGDWVYLVDMIDRHYSDYYKIGHTQDDMKLYFVGIYIDTDYGFDEYGKKWLAYRNKEEAECKGELVELPCKVGDNAFIITIDRLDENNKPIPRIMSGTIFAIQFEGNNEVWLRVNFGVLYCCRRIADFVFTQEEAEQKLKEIVNEN